MPTGHRTQNRYINPDYLPASNPPLKKIRNESKTEKHITFILVAALSPYSQRKHVCVRLFYFF